MDIKKILVTAFLMLSVSACSIAQDDTHNDYKIAYIDIDRIIANSKQIQALKQEYEKKNTELVKWLDGTRIDIQKQKTNEEKEKLAKQYDADFIKKRDAISKDYSTKLLAIDKTISELIKNEAMAKNYDVVLAKNLILYGGDDITEDIVKLVK